STTFTIHDSTADGGTIGDTDVTFQSQDIEIYRAFNSLAAAEANLSASGYLDIDGNLSDNELQLNIPCYADGVDSTECSISGWTTSSYHYIRIYTPTNSDEVGESQRHSGTFASDGYKRGSDATTYAYIAINDDHVRVDGIAITQQGNRPVIYVEDVAAASGGDIRISNCYAHNTLAAGNAPEAFKVSTVGTGVTVKIWNSIGITDSSSAGSNAFEIDDGDVDAYIYNCTGIANAGGSFIHTASNSTTLKNCLGYSASGSSFSGAFDTVRYCASDDATATAIEATGNRINQTFGFVNAGTDNYHLDSTDDAARDYGESLAVDGYISFNTDFDDQSRPQGTSWDIGADEYYPPNRYIWDSGSGSSTVSIVAAGAPENVASGNLASVAVPAGIANNDILIMVLHSRDTVNSTMTSDWASAFEGNANSLNRIEIWWKRTDGTESAPTITHTGGDSAIAIMFAFRGCITTGSPIDVTGTMGSGNSTTITTPAITTNYDDSMVLHVMGSTVTSTWSTYTGTPTNEAGDDNNSAGSDNSGAVAYGVLATAGDTGAAGATQSKLGNYGSVQLALRNNPATEDKVSIGLNWANDLSPSNGHFVTVDSTSDQIEWDVDATFGELSVNGNFTGEITQSENISISGLLNLEVGTWHLDDYNLSVSDLIVNKGVTLDIDNGDLTICQSLSATNGSVISTTGGTTTYFRANDHDNTISGNTTIIDNKVYLWTPPPKTATWALEDDLTIVGDLIINSDCTLDLSTHTLTVIGNLTVHGALHADDAGASVYLTGNWDSTGGTFKHDGNGTIWFYGDEDSYVKMDGAGFNDVYIRKDAVANNVSISDALSVDGDILVQVGNLFTNSELTLWGNLTVSSGAVFTSLGVGETMFFNEADTVGYWINAGATVTWQGSAVDKVYLRSTTSGSQWNFYQLGTKNISYVDVKDSDAWGSSAMINPTNSTDSKNNVYWFPPTMYIWDSGASDYIASTALNWDQNQTPSNTHSVLFNSTSDHVTWDILANLDELTMSSGFGGEITQSVNLSISDLLNVGGGTWHMASYDLSVNKVMVGVGSTLDIDTGDLTVAQSISMSESGVISSGIGEIWLYANDADNTIGGGTITNDVLVSTGGTTTWTLNDDITIAGNLTIASGATVDLGAYTLSVSGALVIQGTFDGSTGELWVGDDFDATGGTFSAGTSTTYFYGTTSRTITSDAESFYDVIVQNGGVATVIALADDMTVTNDLTVNSSTFDSAANELTISGNVDLNANATIDGSDASSIVYVAGNWDSTSGTFAQGSGTVTFYGSADSTVTMGGEEFNAVTIAKTAVSDNVTISDLLSVAGNILVESGTFFTNNELTMNGNLTVSSGAAFTSLGQDVTIFFNNADTVGYWINAGATVTWQGTNGNELKLRSDSYGNQWDFFQSGTKNISYVDVKDSDALGSAAPILPTTSIDSGNNLYWFPQTHYIWDSGGVGNAASTVNNWNENQAPSAGHYVTIDDYADAITWDISTTLAELTVNGSFTGSVTQTQNVYIGGLVNLQVQSWDMNGQELSASDLV
ncbi:beta strand repeat-containing protein, partial [Candidatus Omnitrophota bacterium]